MRLVVVIISVFNGPHWAAEASRTPIFFGYTPIKHGLVIARLGLSKEKWISLISAVASYVNMVAELKAFEKTIWDTTKYIFCMQKLKTFITWHGCRVRGSPKYQNFQRAAFSKCKIKKNHNSTRLPNYKFSQVPQWPLQRSAFIFHIQNKTFITRHVCQVEAFPGTKMIIATRRIFHMQILKLS